MTLFVVLFYALLCVSLNAAPIHRQQSRTKQEQRLIAFNETTRVWMTTPEIVELLNNKIKFIDITEYQHPSKSSFIGVVPSKPSFQTTVEPLLEDLVIGQLVASLQRLSSFTTRYYTSAEGEAAALFLIEEYRRHSSHRTDVTVRPFSHTWRQPSVIARIEGEGPNADEIVILGGHIDSTSSGGNAPGADDDGSGSCTVLEVFRVLAQSGFKPKRTIEFHGYSAEEVGLRGSQAIVADYVNRGITVAGMMQLDMTGYIRAGTAEVIGIVTDYTDAELSAFIRELVTAYTNIPWADTRCGYGCSDHASWYNAGFRSSFPFESIFSNSNPYIHSSNDILSRLSQSHMLEFAKLGLSYVVEMSLSDE